MTSMMRTLGKPLASTVANDTSRTARKNRKHQVASTSSSQGITLKSSSSNLEKASISAAIALSTIKTPFRQLRVRAPGRALLQ